MSVIAAFSPRDLYEIYWRSETVKDVENAGVDEILLFRRIQVHCPAKAFYPDDPVFNPPFDATFGFGSEAANLEYSILKAILDGPPDSPTEPAMNGGSWSTDTMFQNQFGQSPSTDVGGYPSYDEVSFGQKEREREWTERGEVGRRPGNDFSTT